MPNLNMRLKALEDRVKVLETGGVWIDAVDNKVRVDVGTVRGKEIVFPTVYQAGQYIQKWKEKAVTVCGTMFVSWFPDLLYEKPFDPENIISSKVLEYSSILFNLVYWQEGTLEELVVAMAGKHLGLSEPVAVEPEPSRHSP